MKFMELRPPIRGLDEPSDPQAMEIITKQIAEWHLALSKVSFPLATEDTSESEENGSSENERDGCKCRQ